MAEEHYQLPETPVYHELVRRIQSNDPVNADVIMNPLIQAILENIQAVKSEADGKADAEHTHPEYVTADNASEMLSGSLSPEDIGAEPAGTADAAAAELQQSLTDHTSQAAIHRTSQGYRVTLTSTGWSSASPYTQTVSVSGVTAAGSEVVLVYPANKASRTLWQDNGVAAADITTNGKLTFEADSKPTASISVIVEVKDIGLT